MNATELLIEKIENELLPYVSSPSQYIGCEMNIIRKRWSECDVKLALCFPDTYSIGSSSLAMQIIYYLLNSIDGVLCERVFCPWPDAADRMRNINLPLYSLESYRPLREFDIIAFSIPYELLYTNILEIIDLAGLNVWRKQRSETDPLIIIGNSQAHNPEPIADFIDLAIIGEAEATLPHFIEEYRRLKGKLKKDKLIIELAKKFDWLYAPSAYRVEYNTNGVISSIKPISSDIHERINRAYIKDLDSAPYPTKPLVPLHKTVHERINIEIMRGCPHACRFCHEGYTRKPVRFRSVEKIIELAKESYKNTGINEISLCSLSSADYPHLKELFLKLNDYFAPKNVSISLPSLRIEKQLEIIPRHISVVRKSQLTIAIEAATERLRRIIRKNIDLAALKPALMEAYKLGWNKIKLYFIVGLPGEEEKDIKEIVELSRQIAYWRTELGKGASNVNVSISFFVPKSHTPFQWIGQKTLTYYKKAQEIILDSVKRKERFLRFKFHNSRRSKIEALLARGDRRLSKVIYLAWKKGTRFDSWDETFRFDAYIEAIKEAQLSLEFYAERNIPTDEILPWEHINTGLPKERLLEQLNLALQDQ